MAGQPTGTVTLLFTDIEGSTRLLERLGAERYGQALELHRRLLREAFARHDGYEVDSEGDAFFVAVANAGEAVAAALEAQQALAAAAWPEGGEIRVRMGLHTGEPVAAPPKYVGLDVHKAARIMAAGHGGQVLLSEATRRFVPAVEMISLGEHRLKDLLQPESLYQLRIAGLPDEFPVLKTLGNRPNNLPTQPNPLVGREHEVAEVVALLRGPDLRLVTLTGPGGTGKTRLALQVGAELLDDFAGGVFFVSLAPIRDPELVISAVAQALAVREAPGEELVITLATYLERKQMLLLLDNFEQVVKAAGEIGHLLECCEQLKVLVTTRERLRLRPERVYAVPPLPVAHPGADLEALLRNEAVALFAARAEAASGVFTLDAANASEVAEICQRLDGLPLAIELAAARVTTLPPQALLRRLDQRLPLLTGGARDADERQRTLRAAIGWSYELLDPAERQLFECISVFVDGCRLDAAAAVSTPERGADVDFVDCLENLVEKNLLRQRLDPDSEPRFWMLETIREYGLERLREHGRVETASQAHAEHYLAVAERRGDQAHDAQTMRLLEADHANLRATISWFHDTGQHEAELRMVSGLADFWDVRGHYREGWGWIEAALRAAPPGVTTARGRALAAASDFARIAGHVGLARSFCEECLAVSRQLGDQTGIARALHELGEAALEEEAYAEAAAHFEEAVTVGRAAGRPAAGSIGNLGWVALLEGDPERAEPLFLQSVQLFRERGHMSGILVGLSNLAETKLALHRLGEARAYLLEALALADDAEAAGDVAASILETAAALLLEAGAPEDAARLTGASDALLDASGFSLHPAEARRRIATREALTTCLGPRAALLREEGRGMSAANNDLASKALSSITLTDATRSLDGLKT